MKWLEDLTSSVTVEWVQKQVERTVLYFDKTSERRKKIQCRIDQLLPRKEFGVPRLSGDFIFFEYCETNSAPILCLMKIGDEGFEPIFSKIDEPSSNIQWWDVNPDGSVLVCGCASDSSGFQEINIYDVVRGAQLDEKLKRIRSGGPVGWSADGTGFYYSRFPKEEDAPNGEIYEHCSLHFHELGTPQKKDELIYYSAQKKEMMYIPIVSRDGTFLVVTEFKGCWLTNGILYTRLLNGTSLKQIIPPELGVFNFLGNRAGTFYFHTDYNAPNFNIVSIDINNPDIESLQVVLPESDEVIEQVVMIDDSFLVASLVDGISQLRSHDLDGHLKRHYQLPSLGKICNMAHKAGSPKNLPTSTVHFFSLETLHRPKTILECNFNSEKLTCWNSLKCALDELHLETIQRFCVSKDGTRIPINIAFKGDLPIDGNAPAILTGYGSFGEVFTHCFSDYYSIWLEEGGIVANAGVRGGGEYGEKWHQAGKLQFKHNSFDDLCTAAKFLVSEKYTSVNKLAIQGSSGGGLLVAGALVRAPELFGAVLCEIPLTDLVHFHEYSSGSFFKDEYGDPNNKSHEDFLRAHSPLHNVVSGTNYPPTLIVAGAKDQCASPIHAYKFANALQEATTNIGPILLHIEMDCGHALGGRIKDIRTLELDFLINVFGLNWNL